MTERAPSLAGRLILGALDTLDLTQSQLAEAVGIDPRYVWEIIYDRRPVPMSRLDRITTALQFTGEDRDALILADASDRIRRKSARQPATI